MNKIRVFLQLFGAAALAFLALYGLFALVSTTGASQAAGLANTTGASAIPLTMNYQGFLRNPDGSLANGLYTITARIYANAAPTASETILYETIFPNVNVRDGLFNIVLGDDPVLPWEAFSDAPRYIGINLNDGAGELIPRQRLHAVPWALTAAALVDNATVNGLTATGSLTANGPTQLSDLGVSGDATVDGMTQLSDLNVSGDVGVGGAMTITGKTTLSSNLVTSGSIDYQTPDGLLPGYRLLYRDDFEDGSGEWQGGAIATSSHENNTILGVIQGSGVVCKSFILPAGITHVIVRADYYMIDEWDFNDDNAVAWAVDSTGVLTAECKPVFSNIPGIWQRMDNDNTDWPDYKLYQGDQYKDVVKTVEIRAPHNDGNLVVVFKARGLSSLEYWGVDNVEIWGR